MRAPDAVDPLRNEADWRHAIRGRHALGDHLGAFDLATSALALHPGSPALEYEAILALARAGARAQAAARLAQLEADLRRGAADLPDDLARDIASLGPRLLKDAALEAPPDTRRGQATEAAFAYGRVWQARGGYYPAINAASLFVLAERRRLARHWAGIARDLAAAAPEDYWSLATLGEAALILGETAAAGRALAAAAARAGRWDETAATRRQLRWLVAALGTDFHVETALPAPEVRFETVARGSAAGAAGEPGLAFMGITDAVDLAHAERLLARRWRLGVVLPCPEAVLARTLGARGDAGAAARLAEVIARAETVAHVAAEAAAGEALANALCRREAEGLARLRAEALATVARVAVPAAMVPREDGAGRMARAMLFGDMHGFSALSEPEHLIFIERVLGAFAAVLEEFGARVTYTETAGDGLYVVMDEVAATARCALALQAATRPERIVAMGLPATLGLRLGVHYGPVFRRFDRVIARWRFCGQEVVRTARIEPVTPVGAIYVTEQFAAALALEGAEGLHCDYAGVRPMAKGYGESRMYALRAAG